MTDTQIFLICFLLSMCLVILVAIIGHVFAMSRNNDDEPDVKKMPGLKSFSVERGGAPFSPREYVAMGVKMIEEAKNNDARKSDSSGQESAVNNK